MAKYNTLLDVGFQVEHEYESPYSMFDDEDGVKLVLAALRKRLEYLESHPEDAAGAFGVCDTYEVVEVKDSDDKYLINPDAFGDWKRALSHGDEVFWNDPDNGLCSRMLHISSIHWQDEDDEFVIECMDGSVVQGFAGELSGVEEY